MRYTVKKTNRPMRVSPFRVTVLCAIVLLVLALVITAVTMGVKSAGQPIGSPTGEEISSSALGGSNGTSIPSSSASQSHAGSAASKVPSAAQSQTGSAASKAPAASVPAAGTSVTAKIANSDVLSADISISMVGDVLIHQRMRNAGLVSGTKYDYNSYFSEIKYHFQKTDFNLFNMEGPIDANGGNKDLKSYPCFNYPYQIAEALKNAGFHTALTANNHAFDQGWKGVLSTRNHLTSNGLDVVGTYENQEQFDKPYIRDVKGVKVGVLAYSSLDNGMSGTVKSHVAYAMPRFKDNNTDDVPDMIAKAKALRNAGADFIVMALHWGSEYGDQPTNMQKQIARLLAEGGVDVILGDHSHCPQPIEVRKTNRDGKERNSLIVYSTGNFCADQTALSTPLPKTQEGLLVSVGVTRDAHGAYISAASYIPTLCYPDAMWKANGQPVGYRILPAGKYAQMTSKPANISATEWQKCKNAWDRVPKLVGSDIACLAE